MCAHNLFWNACTWLVLEDLIFYGKWTNLHDQLLNGPKHVTNDYLVWSPTFIIQVNTNNIVMWETLHNDADWDCWLRFCRRSWGFKNLLQMEHCVFSEATRSFQPAGCKEQNFSFTQLNRIRTHFLGCRFKDGRYTRAWLVGSDR